MGHDENGIRMLALILLSGTVAILLFALFLREVIRHPMDPPKADATLWDVEHADEITDPTEPDFV
jgi:hypothetical protein